MSEPIELTPEDHKRIAENAENAVNSAYDIDYPYEKMWSAGYRSGAEYATKYERELASTREDSSKRHFHEQLKAQAERIRELEAALKAYMEYSASESHYRTKVYEQAASALNPE